MTCDYRDPCSCGYVDPNPEATKKAREWWATMVPNGPPGADRHYEPGILPMHVLMQSLTSLARMRPDN